MGFKNFSKTAAVIGLLMPLAANAHDGHSNTPVHALLHMLEANGLAIGFLLFVGIGSLAYRAYKASAEKRVVSNKRRGSHDTR